MSTPVHLRSPAPSRAGRGRLRSWLETRGLVGGHRRPAETVRLRTSDGVDLVASYLATAASGAPAVLLLHGFAARRTKPAYAYLADELSRDANVLALDLRGHGESGGVSTLGDREALDVRAGLAWLRRRGHPWVAAVGLSMGATAAVHAAGRGVAPDALVAVSGAARFRDEPETVAMARLGRLWASPWGRGALRSVAGVRVVRPGDWRRPADPVELVARTARPLLVVHGRDDGYFPLDDARRLVAAAGGPATLWVQPEGFGHAEDGIDAGFVTALATALERARGCGRFPAREEVDPA